VSRPIKVVTAFIFVSLLAFSAGTAFGARRAYDASLDQALAALDNAQVYLEISAPLSANSRNQREFSRHVKRALSAVDSARDAVNAAILADQ
jgi:hypothetical protein